MALNIKNRTIYCNDNLHILKGINNSCIDLIYLDPPFNSGREYTGARKSMAELAKFKDSWDEDDENIEWWFQIKEKHPRLHLFLKDVDDYANKSTQVYLTMMAVRVLEMHRILKDTGSLYYHCDQSAGHYVKVLLDIIFGLRHFVDEIIWRRSAGKAKGSQFKSRSLGIGCDHIYHYVKSSHYTHNNVTLQLSEEEINKKFPLQDTHGKYNTATPLFCQPSMGARPNLCYEYRGVRNPHPSGWRVSKEKLIEMDKRGEIIWRDGKRPLRKCYLHNYEGKPIDNTWFDIPPVSGAQDTGWPTQKPLALLERIIAASSNTGDVVLDPFCGCATTCVAAEKLERRWVGIDVWEDAHNIIGQRLVNDFALWEGGTIHKLTKPPTRTDSDPEHKQKRKREYIADEVKEMVWQRDEGKCRNCGTTENLQYDHIIPHSKGGSNEITNLQILCRNCNLTKSNRYFS